VAKHGTSAATRFTAQAAHQKEKLMARNQYTQVLATTLAVLVALLGTPSMPARAAGPTLVSSVASIGAGQTIDLEAAGFVPGERLSVWVTAADQVVLDQGFQSAGADGSVRFGYGVPGDAVGGQWALTVYGERSRTPVIAVFTVAGHAPDMAGVYAGAAPEVGRVGTTFTFFALGYRDRERYSYWFTGPDGAVYDPHSQEARANDSGHVEFTWTAPAGLPKGRFVVTIQGVRSGVARGIVFELR
jgi:hypothetical protein